MGRVDFDPTVWAGRKFVCRDTGEELIIPEDVRLRQFFSFGKCFVDVGEGYYGRFGGNLEEVLEDEE